MFDLQIKITKSFILSQIADIDIWAYYSGLSFSVIENCIQFGKTICSPLRTDKNPSFGFYRDRNTFTLRGQDFAGYFHGDCFDLVGNNFYLNANDSKEFNKILTIIAKDFNLLKSDKKTTVFEKIVRPIQENKETIIDVIPENFSNTSIIYWQNLNCNEKFLIDHCIYEVAVLYVNNSCVYKAIKNKPVFAYFIKESVTKIEWKIYFPFKLKTEGFKFLTNSNNMWGMIFIKESEYGIITKSTKDAMFLKSIGLESVALVSETILPTKEELELISKMWKNVIVFTDFDYTGIVMANKLKKRIKCKCVFLTNGKFNTVNYRSKDITDYAMKNGISETINLIKWWRSENI